MLLDTNIYLNNQLIFCFNFVFVFYNYQKYLNINDFNLSI